MHERKLKYYFCHKYCSTVMSNIVPEKKYVLNNKNTEE